MINVIPFDNRFLDEATELFSLVYSDETGGYPVDLARKRLEEDLQSGRDYSFVALDENDDCLGEIFCKLVWGDAGRELFIDSIQVKPEARQTGVGKKLIAVAINKAKQTGISGVQFVADSNKPFPTSWYEEMGIKKTKWVMFAAKIGEVKV